MLFSSAAVHRFYQEVKSPLALNLNPLGECNFF